jgi:hypothetical protein
VQIVHAGRKPACFYMFKIMVKEGVPHHSKHVNSAHANTSSRHRIGHRVAVVWFRHRIGIAMNEI